MKNQQKVWRDAQIIKLSLQCVKSVQPIRWVEVLRSLRGSKRFRRDWIKNCYKDNLFMLYRRLYVKGLTG